MRRTCLTLLLLASTACTAAAQQAPPDRVPLPGERNTRPRAGARGITEPDEPEHPEPAARDVRDAKYRVSLHVPAGWRFENEDGQLSNFGKEVRTAQRGLQVRGVAALNFNPYPVSTFSGATFYYSAMPGSSAPACSAMATGGRMKPKPDVQAAGMTFRHGEDHHGAICTETRDEVFTTLQGKSCLRFDLVINTFCAQTSGAMEISREQLADVQGRLGKIFDSIRLDAR